MTRRATRCASGRAAARSRCAQSAQVVRAARASAPGPRGRARSSIRTTGDRIAQGAAGGGRRQGALREGDRGGAGGRRIDCAVHSLKDVPARAGRRAGDRRRCRARADAARRAGRRAGRRPRRARAGGARRDGQRPAPRAAARAAARPRRRAAARQRRHAARALAGRRGRRARPGRRRPRARSASPRPDARAAGDRRAAARDRAGRARARMPGRRRGDARRCSRPSTIPTRPRAVAAERAFLAASAATATRRSPRTRACATASCPLRALVSDVDGREWFEDAGEAPRPSAADPLGADARATGCSTAGRAELLGR